MLITDFNAELTRVPPAGPTPLPVAGKSPAKPVQRRLLIVVLKTDKNLEGIGFVPVDAHAALPAIVDEMKPLIVGQDPLKREQLYSVAGSRFHLRNAGLEAAAYSAIDLALWDLFGKSAQQPIHRLLGGARSEADAIHWETADPALDADAVVDIARPCLARNMQGLIVGVAGVDPVADAAKIQHVRDAVGDQVWFGVTAHQAYDPVTALQVGRFLEEEIDADWFESPVPISDTESYDHLSRTLELPLAGGGGLADCVQLIARTRTAVIRPDIAQIGGLTPLLKIIGLAEMHHRKIVPRGMSEIGQHLACGLSAVPLVECDRRYEPLWTSGLRWDDGRIAAPSFAGWGIEMKRQS